MNIRAEYFMPVLLLVIAITGIITVSVSKDALKGLVIKLIVTELIIISIFSVSCMVVYNAATDYGFVEDISKRMFTQDSRLVKNKITKGCIFYQPNGIKYAIEQIDCIGDEVGDENSANPNNSLTIKENSKNSNVDVNTFGADYYIYKDCIKKLNIFGVELVIYYNKAGLSCKMLDELNKFGTINFLE